MKRAFSKAKPRRILSVLFLAAVLAFSAGTGARADDVTYDGDGTLSELPVIPNYGRFNSVTPNSLFRTGSGNNITINYTPDADKTNPSSVFGGFSDSDDANGNTVTIENGRIYYSEKPDRSSVFGGFTYSANGNANGNEVVLESGGTVEYSIFGGVAYGDGKKNGDGNKSGNAEGNTVTISGGTVGETVTGGFSYYGSASGNKVKVESSVKY